MISKVYASSNNWYYYVIIHYVSCLWYLSHKMLLLMLTMITTITSNYSNTLSHKFEQKNEEVFIQVGNLWTFSQAWNLLHLLRRQGHVFLEPLTLVHIHTARNFHFVIILLPGRYQKTQLNLLLFRIFSVSI